MTEPHPPSIDDPGSTGRVSGPVAADARDRAIQILTDAYAYDVITDSEFERRLGLLGLGATRASLDAVVADLPGAGHASRDMSLRAASLFQSEGRIVGFMSDTRRKGPWRLPQRLIVRAVMCDMKLDLRYAAIPPGCSIEVKAVMSSVSLIAPPGLIVDFNIDPIMAYAESDADGGHFGGVGATHVRVHGSAIMAEVRVRVRQLGR